VIAAGQTIGNYRILSKLGTGGMGAVYLAEHPLIGKKVALKVIHRELAGNREVVQRFFQEARAVNTIGSEHIVEIHDFGVTPEGDHFYIMEYLDGRTLASVLSRETAIEVRRALHIGAQIAKALGAAHAASVIHRDLKPDNIMLTTRLGDPDFVKVLDFGLAKVLADGASSVKTAYGVLLGTPQYMSPEACESKRDVDHRTDIYALGVLLFQMMTGVLPFDGESMGEVLVKQVTTLPPAPRGLNPRIPPSVEQVLLRCLAKQPDLRFQTMAALRDALLDPEAYLRGSPPIAPARSVSPGEAKLDARTVLAPGAAAAGAMPVGGAAAGGPMGQAGVAPGPRLPPGAGMPPGMAPPAEPVNYTMRIATPLGYSSRPPRKMWPIVLVGGLLLGLGAGSIAVAWWGRGPSTGEASGSAGSAEAGSEREGSGSAGATTGSSGSGSAGVAAGSSGSAGAAAGSSSGSAGAPAGSSSGSAGVAVSSGGSAGAPAGSSSGSAGSAASSSGSAAPAASRAKLTIESVPGGASVHAPDGAALGKTPLKLEWQMSPQPVTFELRLPGYRRRTKEIVISGNTTVRVELEPMPAPSRPPGAGSSRASGSDSGLMRPE
jgi:tRNA A-37 threonylcarbamoyl transferase component Bud32